MKRILASICLVSFIIMGISGSVFADYHSLKRQASALLKEGKYKEAEELYRQIISEYPNYVIALNTYANLLLNDIGNYEEAKEIFIKALNHPNATTANKGYACTRLGDYYSNIERSFADAEKYYRRADNYYSKTSAKKAHRKALYNWAILYVAKDKFPEMYSTSKARKILQKSIKIGGENNLARIAIAYIYATDKDCKNALGIVDNIDLSTETFRGKRTNKNNTARVYSLCNKKKEAIALFREALYMYPNPKIRNDKRKEAKADPDWDNVCKEAEFQNILQFE